MASRWTEDHVKRLTHLWEVQKLSYSQISKYKEFNGFSRHAIAGKVDRLGLEKRRDSDPTNFGFTRDAKREKRRKAKELKKKELMNPSKLPPSLAKGNSVSPFKVCQWIYGEPTVTAKKCGDATVPGFSWCQKHYNIVFPGNRRVKETWQPK